MGWRGGMSSEIEDATLGVMGAGDGVQGSAGRLYTQNTMG